MVKNIPNKYNLPLMLETINKNHKGKFDFFYLPIDFRVNRVIHACLLISLLEQL